MITLGVRDLDAAIRFYRDGLGFPKMDSSPEVALFTLNGTWLGSYDEEKVSGTLKFSLAVFWDDLAAAWSIPSRIF